MGTKKVENVEFITLVLLTIAALILLSLSDDGDNEDNHILNMERIDATENNIKVIHKYFAGTLEKGVDAFDEFIPGETQKSLERLLSFSSGFIIRD